MGKRAWLGVLLTGTLLMGALGFARVAERDWSDEELAQLRGLWIGSLAPLAPDPSNRVADDPRAIALGQALFFDTRLSANGQVACATCHLPGRQFQDDRPLARGVGQVARRTMPLAGVAHGAWFFWDGRKDSLWSQALGPLESPVEHGLNRARAAHLLKRHYRAQYEALFGPLPPLQHLPNDAGPLGDARAQAAWKALTPADQSAVNRTFANMGKALAAYQRQLQFAPSRFDRHVEAALARREPTGDSELTHDERAGLALFIGKAQCTQCHNGPLFTDNHFHNTGVPAIPGLAPDTGRAAAIPAVLQDEFNCLGPYSDAKPSDCAELRFMSTDARGLTRAYKPPTLRNVALRPPYMHGGQFATLEQVLAHYNRAPRAPAGHSELKPLGLSKRELQQLAAFLQTLSGPLSAAPGLLQAPMETRERTASTADQRAR